jgi:hypothetical protein
MSLAAGIRPHDAHTTGRQGTRAGWLVAMDRQKTMAAVDRHETMVAIDRQDTILSATS